MIQNTILEGNALTVLATLPAQCIQAAVTSPPYWGMRDYQSIGQIGSENTPQDYVDHLVEIFKQIRRVLTKDGSVWLNLGDTYAGSGKGQWSKKCGGSADRKNNKTWGKPIATQSPSSIGMKSKDMVGIPWMVAFALRADGWYLRSDVIWNKPNVKPENVHDRPTNCYEHVFLLSKSRRYYYDENAVEEPRIKGGVEQDEKRRMRNVWTIPTKPYAGVHFATFPVALVEPCILSSSRIGSLVLDPFIGSGTVGIAALLHGRNYLGIEINTAARLEALERIERETSFCEFSEIGQIGA